MELIDQLLSNPGTIAITGGVIFAVIVVLILVSKLIPDNSADRKAKLLEQSKPMIAQATKLAQDNYPDQAIIQAHKAVEFVMKGLLQSKFTSSFDAIKHFQSKKSLSRQSIDRAHNLRIQRNKAAHSSGGFTQQQAKLMISDAGVIIQELLK